jgi:hypothetical protein
MWEDQLLRGDERRDGDGGSVSGCERRRMVPGLRVNAGNPPLVNLVRKLPRHRDRKTEPTTLFTGATAAIAE